MAEFRTSADHLCPIARKTISKLGKTFPPNSRFKRNNVFIYKTNKTLNQLFSSAHWQRHGHRTYWWSINNQSWKIRSSSLLRKELLFLALVSNQVPNSQTADVLEEKEDFFWSLLLKENDWFPLLFASVIQIKPMFVKRK